MELNKRLKDILEKDIYVTSSSEKKLFPTIKFYSHLFYIVYTSSVKAGRKKYGDIEWANSSFSVFETLESLGVKFNINGFNHIRNLETPCVFIANHMSTLETFVLPAFINPLKKIVYVVKKELVDYPIFGKVNNSRDPIVVGRKNPREDLITVFDEGKNRLNSGKSVVIFPQKTRRSYVDFSEFNSLGVKLAIKNNVPIIPLAIISDAWENGKRVKDFGKINTDKEVVFSFGEPIFNNKNSEEIQKLIKDYIKQVLSKFSRKDLIYN